VRPVRRGLRPPLCIGCRNYGPFLALAGCGLSAILLGCVCSVVNVADALRHSSLSMSRTPSAAAAAWALLGSAGALHTCCRQLARCSSTPCEELSARRMLHTCWRAVGRCEACTFDWFELLACIGALCDHPLDLLRDNCGIVACMCGVAGAVCCMVSLT
jgi:hypothetical protein